MGDAQNRPGRSSRWTLTWGGAGLAVASLFPVVSNSGLVLPAVDVSWAYANHTVFERASAIALIAAFVVLALGLRREAGIAGPSIAGRVALIVFAVAHTASTGYFTWTEPSGDADPVLLTAQRVLVWGLVLSSLAALIVAAIVVFRAGVVRGLARWALPALAAAMVVALLASTVPSLAFLPVWIGALIASLLIQLATGVLFVVEGQRAPRADGVRVAAT